MLQQKQNWNIWNNNEIILHEQTLFQTINSWSAVLIIYNSTAEIILQDIKIPMFCSCDFQNSTHMETAKNEIEGRRNSYA